ncbi:MAG: aminotransferase class I/II-fold pyridoxal phosphate-dependent enzyme [Parcubacteria group bacterium]|nr:aminotransferase class I/II-fold pyridoxal phosphate-dependent enzyme [Parcubacteria group bacterium]
MKITASKLRDWNSEFEFSVKYNISDCSTYALTTKELFSLAGKKARNEYLNLSLKYTESLGDPLLRQAVSKLYLNLKKENILATNGAIEAIFLIMNSLLNKGDNIIAQFPIYQALYQVAQSNGVKIRRWNLKKENNFLPDLAELNNLIDKNTKMIVINQPQVPIGSIMDKDMLETLINIAGKYNLYIVSDEVCLPLAWASKNMVPALADIYKKGISIGDISKPFGAGGLRIGWIATQSLEIFKNCLALRGYTTMSNSGPSEYLAALILKSKDKILEPRLKTLRKNFARLIIFVRKNKDFFSLTTPRGGATAFISYNFKINSDDFCRQLIKKYNILLVPGNVYGLENYLRIGLGAKPVIFQTGLKYLEKFVKQFK